MADNPLESLFGVPRSKVSQSSPPQLVLKVKTYDQLEQQLTNFLASSKLKLLRISIKRWSGWWGIGLPSALRRVLKANLEFHTRLGKVIWVKLPYDRRHGWTLRTVQRRVAEGVLGVNVTKVLMDGPDEDDDYNNLEVKDRGLVTSVSRQITEKLMHMGRFLLVIENWWDAYSPELQSLGLPLPSTWLSPMGSKIILWDPLCRDEITSLGEPITNAWLLLDQPPTNDRLTYLYWEASDMADVLNNLANHSVKITPQEVLCCLLFTLLTVVQEKEPMSTHPLHLSRVELVQIWIQNGLISIDGSTGNLLQRPLSKNIAEALLEEFLHRRILFLFSVPNNEAIDSWTEILKSMWDFTTNSFAIHQGYQVFQPYKFFLSSDSNTLGDLNELEKVLGMSIVYERYSRKVRLPLDDHGGPKLCNLRVLILDTLPSFPTDDFFLQMGSLRVLLISRANKVSSLPSSLFVLPNLRILMLRDCKSLETFFIPDAPKRALYGLQILDLSGSGVCHFPDQAFVHMCNLKELILRSCPMSNIMSENLTFFTSMQTLQVIDLSNNEKIQSLPESLVIVAPNLKRLLLSDCSCLRTLSLKLYSHSALEELDLQSCPALEDEEIEFKMPMLKIIRLSGSPAILRLSFRGCPKLEIVQLYALENLESLNLSSTATKELDMGTFPSRSLLFWGAINLKTFPWKHMEYFPEELILDQCMVEGTRDFDSIRRQSSSGKGVWMYVQDGRFFRMLCSPNKSPFPRSLVSSFSIPFYISVSPFVKQGKKKGNIGGVTQSAPLQYKRIHLQYPMILERESILERHVEISKYTHPNDLYAFLKNTLSLSVTNQPSYKSVSELMPVDSVVQQCQIQKCHGMKAIFVCFAGSCILQYLKSVWASELRTMVSFAVEKGKSFNWSQGFQNLKHIHLEFCPRLKYIFPYRAQWSGLMKSLEVLEILSCPNLKEIFASPSQELNQPTSSLSSHPTFSAPCLRIVHLLQLPSLVSICHEDDVSWPGLERFKVRGCWRLKKLPFLASLTSGMVKIDAEPVWWESVLQGGGIIANYVFHPSRVDVPFLMPKD